MKSRIIDIFGIKYPIIQAPMNWATDAKLVASVSEAGGLGTLGPNAGSEFPTSDVKITGLRLLDQIDKIRNLTNKPFAVNFPIGHGNGRKFSDECIEVAIKKRIPIAITSTGSPEVYTQKLKKAGIVVVHAVSSVYHARKAEYLGVDAIVAEGFDGGGHSGFDEIPTMSLIPQIVDAVDIPVIAAGGICESRGFMAAFCLGAEGVYMGTRFLASEESPIHTMVKQALVEAGDNSTVSWGRRTGVARTLKNKFSEQIRMLELQGTSDEGIQNFIQDYNNVVGRRAGGLIHADLENGEIFCGTGVGLIKEVLPSKMIIDTIMNEAKYFFKS
jgi:enoyl-[acyl-carrier protein] reductase II